MHKFWTWITRPFDALLRPFDLFAELAQTGNLRPGFIALGLTSVLFAGALATAELLGTPLPSKPLFACPYYSWIQAAASPLIFGLGWLICGLSVLACSRLLHVYPSAREVFAISGPALFTPLVLLMWPTEMSLALGVLSHQAGGFPGLWVRHLGPSLTLVYLLGLLGLAYWQAFRLLLREAFALAVLGLVPVLVLWSWLFR